MRSFSSSFTLQIYFNWSGPNLVERSGQVWSYIRGQNRVKLEIRSKVRLLWGTSVVLIVNIGMAIFFVYKRKPGVSRYLLAIMMINMVLYVSFYLFGKLQLRLRRDNWYPSEGIRKITIMYGLLSMVFMAGAVTFFIKELKTSAGTPAESRNLNDGCFFLIFDNHDMWHFLSASGQQRKTEGISPHISI